MIFGIAPSYLSSTMVRQTASDVTEELGLAHTLPRSTAKHLPQLRMAKTRRTPVEMLVTYYAAHLQAMLDVAAIDVRHKNPRHVRILGPSMTSIFVGPPIRRVIADDVRE